MSGDPGVRLPSLPGRGGPCVRDLRWCARQGTSAQWGSLRTYPQPCKPRFSKHFNLPIKRARDHLVWPQNVALLIRIRGVSLTLSDRNSRLGLLDALARTDRHVLKAMADWCRRTTRRQPGRKPATLSDGARQDFEVFKAVDDLRRREENGVFRQVSERFKIPRSTVSSAYYRTKKKLIEIDI